MDCEYADCDCCDRTVCCEEDYKPIGWVILRGVKGGYGGSLARDEGGEALLMGLGGDPRKAFDGYCQTDRAVMVSADELEVMKEKELAVIAKARDILNTTQPMKQVDLQTALGIVQAYQIMEDHGQALIENEVRDKKYEGSIQGEEAWLTGISRGFGGDNAFYESKTVPPQKITVAVGWALLAGHDTTVIVDGEEVAVFNDPEYIQPHTALARLGYEVHGTIDFAQVVPDGGG